MSHNLSVHHGNNSRKPTASTPEPEKKQGITISTPVAMILGIIVVATIVFLTLRDSPSRQVIADTPIDNQWSARVVSVAKRFICPCGNCNDNLVVCNCTDGGGAFEIKTFIRNGLHEGKTTTQMVAAVASKYKIAPMADSN